MSRYSKAWEPNWKVMLAVAIAALVLILAFYGTVIGVAIHFIKKFW